MIQQELNELQHLLTRAIESDTRNVMRLGLRVLNAAAPAAVATYCKVIQMINTKMGTLHSYGGLG
jgi:hypothetical protein